MMSLVSVTGTVMVPNGELTVTSLPSAISSSAASSAFISP
jgi:hypothetical protein